MGCLHKQKALFRLANLQHFNLDPDPSFYFNALTEPDPAFHFNGDSDPDPAFHSNANPDPNFCFVTLNSVVHILHVRYLFIVRSDLLIMIL